MRKKEDSLGRGRNKEQGKKGVKKKKLRAKADKQASTQGGKRRRDSRGWNREWEKGKRIKKEEDEKQKRREEGRNKEREREYKKVCEEMEDMRECGEKGVVQTESKGDGNIEKGKVEGEGIK